MGKGEVHGSTIFRATGAPRKNRLDGAAIYRIALGEEAQPDDWQQALMDEEWPQVLIAPTGSGSSLQRIESWNPGAGADWGPGTAQHDGG